MQPGKIWLIFELNTGTQSKINSAWGFWADVPDFIFVYENGGQSDYRRIPQDPLILAFSIEFSIL